MHIAKLADLTLSLSLSVVVLSSVAAAIVFAAARYSSCAAVLHHVSLVVSL